MSALEVGKTYEVWWPFQRSKYTPPPEPVVPGDYEGRFTKPPEEDTWTPGWRVALHGCSAHWSERNEWDGDGAMLLTIVSLHKPGPTYPERAFYIRQWRDPDGKVFGKKGLRVVSSRALKAWLAGSRTAHLEDDRSAALESSRALFAEALAMVAA